MDNDLTAFRWLECLLALSAITLFFQLFPGAWWALVSAADVRNWTWRSYAVVSGLALALLVGLKAWRER